MTTTSFATTALDEAADLMASAQAGRRLRISAGCLDGLRLAQTRHDYGQVHLDTCTSTPPLDFHTHPEDVVMRTWMRDGGLDGDGERDRFTVRRGDLCAVTAHRPCRAVTTSTTTTTVGIRPSLLTELEHQLLHPTRAKAWLATVTAVTDHLTGPVRQLAEQPEGRLLVHSTNRILAGAMPRPTSPGDGASAASPAPASTTATPAASRPARPGTADHLPAAARTPVCAHGSPACTAYVGLQGLGRAGVGSSRTGRPPMP